jgi:hypothetical protein
MLMTLKRSALQLQGDTQVSRCMIRELTSAPFRPGSIRPNINRWPAQQD